MITIIAAVAKNYVLGKDNKLIWHLPADLKRFKKVTAGHYVIMGRKTYESLGKPLPNRTNIIISRNVTFKVDDCLVVNSLQKAIEAAKSDTNPFILGGAEIYKQAITFADKLDITFVHHNFDGDAFFPKIDTTIWKETSREDFEADDKNKYPYSFVTFIRKNKETPKGASLQT